MPTTDLYQSVKQRLFAPVPPPPVEKTFIPLTPEEIAVSLEGIKNKLDLDDIARSKYYGKYVKWIGEIDDIYPESNDIARISFLFKYDNEKGSVVLVITRFYKHVIRHLNKGNKITVIGMISLIKSLADSPPLWTSIYLEYCQLVDSPQ